MSGKTKGTVAELLRKCHDEEFYAPCSVCRDLFGDDNCDNRTCWDVWGAIADRVEAEVAEARALSAREGMAIIAGAEGWPPLHDGESVTEWMVRCWLPRLRYEGGEIVDIGDGLDGTEVCSYEVSDTGTWVLYDPCSCMIQTGLAGDRVKRHVPEVLLCDGKPAKRGERVWRTTTGHEGTVDDVEDGMVLVHWVDTSLIDCPVDPSWLAHTPPALAADGKPLREGDAVWLLPERWGCAGKIGGPGADESHALCGIGAHDRLTVSSVYHRDGVARATLVEQCAAYPASWLTHEEPDSLAKIEADAVKAVKDYWGCGEGVCDHNCPAKVDGKMPCERYGTHEGNYSHVVACGKAAALDILRRQRAVLARGGE